MELNHDKNTPLMQQYLDIKEQFPDTLVLFQVGDFYELFFDDAKKASSYLAIALTKRGKNKGEDVPLCGIPVHALNHYLTKLIKGGFRVAVCDQLSKPQPGTVVQRGISRVFTPATLTESTMLDEKSASYLLSFFPCNNEWSLLFGELMTAQLFATAIPINSFRMVEAELIRFIPDEILLPNTKEGMAFDLFFKKMGYYTTMVGPTDIAGPDIPAAWMKQQLNTATQNTIHRHPTLSSNLELLYWYLKKNQEKALTQFTNVHYYEPDEYLILDAATQKSLEIITNKQDDGRKNTLFAILDQAQTAMGSRTIKKWLQRPLVQKTSILQRQEVIASLLSNLEILQTIQTQLKSIADIERIIGRIALKRATINDYLALKDSLLTIPALKQLLTDKLATSLATTLQQKIADFTALTELLACSINDDQTTTYKVKKGYDHQLDHLRDLLKGGQQEIIKLEQQEIKRTGITSLKIGFNQISGYYIEVTNPNLDKVPEDYRHQQTLANRKRFITQALLDLERDLNKAQNELESIENSVFEQVKNEVETYVPHLRHCAYSIAYLDALVGFTLAAYNYRYTAPQFNDQHNIIITAGRHPVVEQSLPTGFTPNDCHLVDTASTWIITGPNMGGKSTYLRQVALVCIMAQCGSFVPATAADLPILDRIFTRIGSGDNVAEGKSTFLVEMEEAATICTQATRYSLVILDEVGRGTSTYDGMALAQAIIEYIHQQLGARCLFATHYHELTILANKMAGIANYHTACKKINDSIMFLHKVMPGEAAGSFGIDVAKLAQLPDAIIQRASTILQSLNDNPSDHNNQQTIFAAQPRTLAPCNHEATIKQLNQTIIELEQRIKQQDAIISTINELDPNNMTPKQAMDVLWSIRQKE